MQKVKSSCLHNVETMWSPRFNEARSKSVRDEASSQRKTNDALHNVTGGHTN